MEINKKSRTELKGYFVKNALPTASNFSDLIDAGLNQKDDGIAKSADQPVQIAASTAGDKPAIHLYESFATDTKPAWVLSLQADTKKGLGIGDGDGNSRLFIDGVTGGVGIGTADPAGNKLRVAGNVLVDGADGKARVSFGSSNRQMLNLSTEAYGIGVQTSTAYFRSSSNFAFYKGGVHADGALDPGAGGAAMLVIKDGNVGIKTATPPEGLSLASGVTLMFGVDDTNREVNNGKIAYKRFTRGLDIVGAADSTDPAKREITFHAQGGSKFLGDVLVRGAITPSVGNSASNGIMFPTDPGTGGGDSAWIRYMVISGETTKLRIGIDNDPDDTLSLWQAGAERLLISNGQVSVNGVHISSDRRLKRDIAPLGPSLGRVLRLAGVYYRWVDEKIGSGLQIGLIAQDVEAVFPELVSATHEGTKGVDYARLVAPLIEAVKELAAEVEALKRSRTT
ncbi:tail fiber domain-containing protein [Sorangium sp. So ce260]|uniref:tail fiber domain-containing protein n=1 Tax=Sorangium sp. So ce260 TaxID=3133291 RepID=UPI003F5EBCC0